MKLRGVALNARINPEAKPNGELLIFQFEPLGIDQSGLGIDSRTRRYRWWSKRFSLEARADLAPH
jgi:hypothetical protein